MIQETGIWKRVFEADIGNSKITRLVTSLESFRGKVGHLTSKITAVLPQLTIHDITHLDALWEVANTIVGDDFPLNPLEAYIFGGAVLLHDAALCFEAYSGGQQGLRNTVVWRDAYARLSGLNRNAQDVYQEADFETLRHLHASQAGKLAVEPWRSESNDPVYLIEDSELRESYGHLIGEIAASHHWDIDIVAQTFSTPRPPASFLLPGWIVDPLKIACMLRVADAGHLDGRRAPSFLLKVLHLNSISKTHWEAQNRLGRVMVDPDDPTELIIASTGPFSQNEATAWWVAFDAIALFDKEIRDCNAVLARGGFRRNFPRQGVAGAGKVKELTKHVRTSNWEPTDTKVHVSDVASLIQRLGGAELYGMQDRLQIVLREVIQNALDAIIARQEYTQESFDKRIIVRLSEQVQGRGFVLQIDDDGVGMSQKTLAEDLMDFGKSFWSSARASQEFPGIHASGYDPVGRFGIGFFSVFMIADRVKVFSRRFDEGLDSVRCLSFENGLSLRPTLSKQRPEAFGMDLSTRVEIEFRKNFIPDPGWINIHAALQGHTDFGVPFYDYVAAIVSGVGTRVFVEWNGKTVQVHGGFPPETEVREDWLKTLSYVGSGVNLDAQGTMANHVHRLREIRDGKNCYGLAAIGTSLGNRADFLSAKAVGGLVSPHDRHGAPFVGLIDHLPRNAKREAGEIRASRESIKTWLEEQVILLKEERLNPIEYIAASYALCEFDYDPMELLRRILVLNEQGNDFWPLDQMTALLNNGKRLGFRVSSFGSHLEQFGQQPLAGVSTCAVLKTGKFNDVKFEGDVPKNPNSLIGVVHRRLEEQGQTPAWLTIPNAYDSPFGKCDCLEVRITGDPSRGR